MKIWKLELNVYGLDWESNETYFFLSENEAETYMEEYERSHKKENGLYIPTICGILYNLSEEDFEDSKREMTISQYEKLFNTTIVAIER